MSTPGFAASGHLVDVRVRRRRRLLRRPTAVVVTVRWCHGGSSQRTFPVADVDAVRAYLDLLSRIDPHDERGDFSVV